MTILNVNPARKAIIHPVLDNIFNELMNAPVADISQAKHMKSNRPAANVIEEKNQFKIHLAIPGLSKNDINIQVEKNILTISTKQEEIIEEGKTDKPEIVNEKAKAKVLRREFNFSDFERKFKLPKTVDTLKIAASSENGILNIVLPKKEEAIEKGPINISVL